MGIVSGAEGEQWLNPVRQAHRTESLFILRSALDGAWHRTQARQAAKDHHAFPACMILLCWVPRMLTHQLITTVLSMKCLGSNGGWHSGLCRLMEEIFGAAWNLEPQTSDILTRHQLIMWVQILKWVRLQLVLFSVQYWHLHVWEFVAWSYGWQTHLTAPAKHHNTDFNTDFIVITLGSNWS